MLRTFLVENDSKQRAIVTEYELPTSPDWHIVRQLGVAADPIGAVEILHNAVAMFANVNSPAILQNPPGAAVISQNKKSFSWLHIAVVAGGAYLIFR